MCVCFKTNICSQSNFLIFFLQKTANSKYRGEVEINVFLWFVVDGIKMKIYFFFETLIF
jgi:hypothetical protein